MKDILAIIIDDEKKAIELLELNLKDIVPSVRIVGTATSAEEGLKLIHEKTFDLLFLDIDLKDASGFDLLKQFYTIDFQIIFITAFNDYALAAFEVNAIDYLLKPVDPEKLKKAVEKAEYFVQNDKNERALNVSNLLNHVDSKDKLAIHEQGRISFINLYEVIYFEADGQYTNIKFENGKTLVCSQNLGYFEKVLMNDTFFRIHRSYLINLKHVTGINSTSQKVEFENGFSVTFSQQKKEEFLKRMEEQ